MALHRRPEIPYGDAPRGQCRWCGDPILYDEGEHAGEPNRRRRWHPRCVDAYNESDPREARRRIRKRDRGRCAECGVDTYALRREFKAMKRGRTKAMRDRGFKPRQSLWELDHIVPLVDGGSHDDSNLQTLCTPCHKAKTALEAAKRAAQARGRARAHDDAMLESTTPSTASEMEADMETKSDNPDREPEGALEIDVDAEPGAGEVASPERASAGRDGPAQASEPAAQQEPRSVTAPPSAARRRTRRRGDELDTLLAAADATNARVEAVLAEMQGG